MDLDEILRGIAANGTRDLTLKGLTLPNGVSIAEAEINTPEDEAALQRVLAKLAETDPLTACARGYIEPPASTKGPTLATAIKDHLSDLKRARLAAKTELESRHTLRIFSEVVGEGVPVSALNQSHVRAFLDVVSRWPSNATKREPYKGKGALEVVRLAEANGEPAPAAYTQTKHRQRLSVFLVSQINAGHLQANPLAGVRAVATPNDEDTGVPFTDAELAVIFGPAFVHWASKYPHRWFGVALGLYSGARVNEVAQLRVEDVGTEDDVPGFYVRNRAKGQSIKNKSARRFVPLAKPLLEAGLLTYVEEAKAAGHDRLFPNLPNSTGLGFGPQLSRQFSAYIKEQGITTKGQGYHGFRHTIASRLDAAGVSEAAIAVLTGHKRAGSILQRHYIDRASLPDRVATLARFVPPVRLPDYTPGQFAKALQSAPKRLRVLARPPIK